MIVRGIPVWPPAAVVAEIRRRRLVRDVAVLQASNALQRVLGFGFSVITARVLGVTGYGEYLLVLSLHSTLNLVGNMGVGQFLVVPLAQSVATRDREAIARGAGYVLKFGAALGLAVLTLILLVGEWAGDLIMHRPELGALTRIVAVGILPTVAYTTAVTALQAGRRMPVLSAVEVVDLLVGRGCAVGFVLVGVAGGESLRCSGGQWSGGCCRRRMRVGSTDAWRSPRMAFLTCLRCSARRSRCRGGPFSGSVRSRRSTRTWRS